MIFPLILWDVSAFLAIAAIALLIASELVSPLYGRTKIVVNKRRLRNAALLTTVVFLATIAVSIYNMAISM